MGNACENLEDIINMLKSNGRIIVNRIFKRPKKVDVRIKFPFGSISGTWEVDENQSKAAWELYVELITRISIQKLGPDQGLLREALTSLYNLFGETRKILRNYGPAIGKPLGVGKLSCGEIALQVLNSGLRPVLAKWHPLLADYENTKPDDVSQTAHEKAWGKNKALREELVVLQASMRQYADTLAEAAGTPGLKADGDT
ncbi:hypothetical protein QUF75_13545 [Desulfococcaceae bacterium HSG7]|nr:hypothetical protein [Desulfococcaceae bacterium HSG7]